MKASVKVHVRGIGVNGWDGTQVRASQLLHSTHHCDSPCDLPDSLLWVCIETGWHWHLRGQRTALVTLPAVWAGERGAGHPNLSVRDCNTGNKAHHNVVRGWQVFGVAVRHRIDQASGQNTSWALVTMADKAAAERALAGYAKHQLYSVGVMY
jgi:hypothetical protein